MAEKRVDLNTATVQELTQLPGIGPVLAQRVISYRETIQPFDEPADVTAVSGIGEETYRTIADRLVAAPAEGSPLASHRFETPMEEAALSTADVSEEESEVETEPTSEELAAPEEEAEHRMEAVPPGESFSAEPVRLEQETPEEGEEEMPLTAEELSEERTEEGSPEVEQEAVEEEAIREAEAVPPGESFSAEPVRLEEKTSEEGGEETPLVAGEPSEEDIEEAAPEVEQESVEEEAVLEPDEEPLEEEPTEAELPPVSPAPSAEATPSAPWWRRLSWLWTALLGGFLGMIFALIVWAGINGSLDVSHSPAVLSLKGEVNGLAADVQTLGTDVDGLL
ncbi:MAG: helix-hairpin-helix domain-containing protein, partial [Anaerolineae bacterium]|nr:helix-hairpin-helix domain-containing protein [Anaerolineae bacterium]